MAEKMSKKRKVAYIALVTIVGAMSGVAILTNQIINEQWDAMGGGAYDTKYEYYGLLFTGGVAGALVENNNWSPDDILPSFLHWASGFFYRSALEKIPENDTEREVFTIDYDFPFFMEIVQNNKKTAAEGAIKRFIELTDKSSKSNYINNIIIATKANGLANIYYLNRESYKWSSKEEQLKAEKEIIKRLSKIIISIKPELFLSNSLFKSVQITPLNLSRSLYLYALAELLNKKKKIVCKGFYAAIYFAERLRSYHYIDFYKDKDLTLENREKVDEWKRRLDADRNLADILTKDCNLKKEKENDNT